MLKVRLCLTVAVTCLGVAAAGAAIAAGAFDGVYRGTQRTTLTNNSSQCSRIDNDNVVLRIENNHFTKVWSPATLSVDVAADGSFAAETQVGEGRSSGRPRVIRMKGRIAGGDLEADIGSTYCGAHLSLKKS